jgi:hypothetical protein
MSLLFRPFCECAQNRPHRACPLSTLCSRSRSAQSTRFTAQTVLGPTGAVRQKRAFCYRLGALEDWLPRGGLPRGRGHRAFCSREASAAGGDLPCDFTRRKHLDLFTRSVSHGDSRGFAMVQTATSVATCVMLFWGGAALAAGPTVLERMAPSTADNGFGSSRRVEGPRCKELCFDIRATFGECKSTNYLSRSEKIAPSIQLFAYERK